MKVVIFAGGFGTRISEETNLKPKPMIEIGDKPILWHIMKNYSHYGFNEFIILCGYKSAYIKEYFLNYVYHCTDFTIDTLSQNVDFISKPQDDWKISLIDTGINTMTGGRLKRVRHLLGDDNFLLTYGDGLADVDIRKLINFHDLKNKLATLTAVEPVSRYGALNLIDDEVVEFREKHQDDAGLINGGFFVLNPKVIDRIVDDTTVWEEEPLTSLAQDRQLSAFKHNGFWHPMDTKRDHIKLQNLWNTGKAPWKIW